MQRVERVGWIAVASVVVVMIWVLLARLVLVSDAGSQPMLSGVGLLTCLLLFVAPAATFIPIARWIHIPLYEFEAVAAWSTFGFTLTFLRPSDPLTMGQFLLFVVPLTVSLATLGTLLAYLIGLRVYPFGSRRKSAVRARRQGYLGAIYVVALMVLHSIGTLTPTSGVLLLVILVLGEMFCLTRGYARPAARRAAGQVRLRRG
jgi:hypothetical protein